MEEEMKSKLFEVISLMMVLSMLLAACGGATPTPEVITVIETKEVPVEVVKTVIVEPTAAPKAEADTILVGAVGPLSAPGSYLSGIEMMNAMGLAVDEINEAGGLLGKPVELVIGDTEGTPERGTAVAERLISQNGVVGLVGEFHSGPGLAGLEVAHKYGIPFIQVDTWSNDITGSGYPEIFRIAPTNSYYSNIHTNYIKEVGWTSVVHINENTDFGIELAEATKADLEAIGVTVELLYVEQDTEDFTPVLQRIQQNPPDVIDIGLTGASGFRLQRQACELGIAPTAETAVFSNLEVQYPDFWENVGECGVYTVFPYIGLPGSLQTDKTKAFIAKYEETFGQRPGAAALAAYDAINIMMDAITRAGTTESQALILALEETDYEGVQGNYYFEYTSKNPVPADVPAWMWHQWPFPNVFDLQYVEENQSADDALIVFPRELSTGPAYTSP
jgi:ABC-type branched-subunit amino acid transport system substrate-binding protein